MKLTGTIRKALICQQNTLNVTVSSGLMTLMLLYNAWILDADGNALNAF